MSKDDKNRGAVPDDFVQPQPVRWGKDLGTSAPSPLTGDWYSSRGEGWGGGERAGHLAPRLQMPRSSMVDDSLADDLTGPESAAAAMFGTPQPFLCGAGIMKGMTTLPPVFSC